ncbi:F0F1 ATP synthase subunit delta [candidate division KSB1 bacterium]|nr:F0F1 ATP synthase subunit delta [candidate division KSB1 bacterium]
MQINWFTLVAQIVNFMVLLFLLKHFLYHRIVDAMDEREQRIKDRFQEAEEKKQQASEEMSDYERKNKELTDEREQFLAEAKEQAEQERKKLMQQNRDEIDRQRKQWYEALENEKADFLKTLQRKTGQQIYELSRRVLSDLADETLEKQMIAVLIDRVKKMAPEELEEILDSARENGALQVESTFEMVGEQRKEVESALQEIFARDLKIEFVISEDMICGIELKAGGQIMIWSIDDYLNLLQQKFQEQFDRAGAE